MRKSVSIKKADVRRSTFTKAQRQRFEACRAEGLKRIQPQLDAIEVSERLSAADYAVRINAR